MRTENIRNFYARHNRFGLTAQCVLPLRRRCPASVGVWSPIYILLIACVLLTYPLLANSQTVDEQQIQLEEQTIGIIDTTQIQLEPRSQFNDPTRPAIQHVLGLYAKERLWHLPPIHTPQKVPRSLSVPVKNYTVIVKASPGLPSAPSFEALLAGAATKAAGHLQFAYQNLADTENDNRGTYNALKGGLNLTYKPLSQLVLNTQISLKDLRWPLNIDSTPGLLDNNEQTADPSTELRDLHSVQLLRSNFRHSHYLSDKTQLTTTGILEKFEFKQGSSTNLDRAQDLRLSLDARTHFINLANPVHFGVKMGYLSAKEVSQHKQSWSTILEFYGKDNYSLVGPLVIGIGASVISFREREPTDISPNGANEEFSQTTQIFVDRTKLQPGGFLAVTTRLNNQWRFNLEADRSVHHHSISKLYFNSNYVRLNPFLKAEKTWAQQLTLTYHRGQKAELNFGTFAKQVTDLVYLVQEVSNGMESENGELSWIPVNAIELTSFYGARLSLNLQLTDRWCVQVTYQRDLQTNDIPYHPKNRAHLDLDYQFPLGFEIRLDVKIEADRSTGTQLSTPIERTDLPVQLPDFIHFQAELGKSIGQYINGFVGGSYVIGEVAFLPNYPVRRNYLDFGVELGF